ncbi:MAG: energy transducer TonB [Bacteroidia bacterium]|jgi:protein TonB
MKKNFIAIIALGLSLSKAVLAQSNHEEILPPAEKPAVVEQEKDVPFVLVEQMPKFPGGENAMFKYISDNIVYPKAAQKSGIAGTVYIFFIIDKKGNVTSTEVRRGVKGGEELNAEALRVIKEMPQWEPGYQNGKPVSVQLTVPIKFTL